MSNSTIRAVRTGGYATQTDTMDYVTIATTGNAADFGDLVTGLRNCWQVSDSHGGLG